MNPANAGHGPKIIHGEASLGPALPQRLDGDADTDLVPVFETVGNRLRRCGDSHRMTVDQVDRGAGSKRLTAEPDDMRRRKSVRRMARLPVDGQPNLVGDWVVSS